MKRCQRLPSLDQDDRDQPAATCARHLKNLSCVTGSGDLFEMVWEASEWGFTKEEGRKKKRKKGEKEGTENVEDFSRTAVGFSSKAYQDLRP